MTEGSWKVGGVLFAVVISTFLFFFPRNRSSPQPQLTSLQEEANLSNISEAFTPFSTIPSNGKFYTKEEIAKHCTVDDIWVIIFDRVFNLTSYASLHPGGIDILVTHAGTDVTEPFKEVHPDWRKLFPTARDFYIGDLKK